MLETRLFGMMGQVRCARRPETQVRGEDLLASALLDFASSTLKHPGYSPKPSEGWSLLSLFVGGHGEVQPEARLRLLGKRLSEGSENGHIALGI